MEIIVEHIIEIFFGFFSMGMIWLLKKNANDWKAKEKAQEERLQMLENKLLESCKSNENSKNVMMGMFNILQENDIAMLKDKLYQSCSHYLTVKEASKDDFMNLTALYNRYVITGGNGQVQLLYEKVVKEVKINEEGF